MVRSAIVVGAGIAGLTAAYRLQQHGISVRVLERDATPGGRMRSERHGDCVVDRGAQFIASSYRNMLALADELGLSGEVQRLRHARNGVLKHGRIVSSDYERVLDFVRSRDLSLASKLRLPKLAYHLWRNAALLDFYHMEKAAPLDDESTADYVRRTFGDEVLDYLIEPAFASTFTVLPEQLSKAFTLATIKMMLGGFQLRAFRGGNGLLTRTLAERVPVTLNTTVTRIEPGPNGVGVTTSGERGDETLEADHVVVAVPGTAVAGICGGLSVSEQTFFSGVRYAASIIVFVETATADTDPGVYGLGIPRREGVGLYGLAVENVKAGVVPAGKTLFNCAFSEAAAAPLMTASDDTIIEAALRELRKLPLRGLDQAERYVVHRWPALVPQFYPGYHRALARFYGREDRSDRMTFAGDYLVGPYTEAALTSGLRAAEDLIGR